MSHIKELTNRKRFHRFKERVKLKIGTVPEVGAIYGLR